MTDCALLLKKKRIYELRARTLDYEANNEFRLKVRRKHIFSSTNEKSIVIPNKIEFVVTAELLINL